jgi:hypothetical protein
MEFGDVTVKAAGSGKDVGWGWYNAIVTRSSIIGEFDVVSTGHVHLVVLH